MEAFYEVVRRVTDKEHLETNYEEGKDVAWQILQPALCQLPVLEVEKRVRTEVKTAKMNIEVRRAREVEKNHG